MLPGRKCINVSALRHQKGTGFETDLLQTTPLYYASGANNLITDLILLFLPMPIIWKLKLPIRQRLGLVFVFAMGAL